MLFAKPYHPVVINFGLHNFTMAVVENTGGTHTIKSVRQCHVADLAQQSTFFTETKAELATRSKYLRAICHVTPEDRLIRRVEIEGAKFNDTTYLGDIATNQLKIDPAQYDLAVLDSQSGQPIDANTKTAVFVGLPSSLAHSLQTKLTSSEIYPERMGLSSANEIGAYIQLLKEDAASTPTLLLEIGRESSSAYIISKDGLEATKVINQGIDSMLPVIQKDLGLKDEESAKKLLQSNAFDFTSMSASLTKKLVKELQSSIGFFEVQTGLNISQLCCIGLPDKMAWLEASIESQLGLRPFGLHPDKLVAKPKLKIDADLLKQTNVKTLVSIIAALD